MPAIQLRRGAVIPAGEMHHVGEPIWDPERSRFGVFNARTPTAIEWYPTIIGNKMLLNSTQTLGGYTAGFDENNIYMDWSVQDQLTVRNRNTNQVYAQFAAAGASFNALAAIGTAYSGVINLVQNGNLSVRRSAIPITTVDTNQAATRSSLIAPNWQLWKSAGTGGRLIGQWAAYNDVPFAGYGDGVLQINASGAPNSSGLRCFIYGYKQMAGRPITFSVYIDGVNGAQTKVRAQNDNGTVLFNDTHVATGNWQRFTKTVTPAVDSTGDWIGFDVLYNPSFNTSASQTWRVAGVQVQYGTSASEFENRPRVMERALCESVYSEGQLYASGGTVYVPLTFNNYEFGPRVEAIDTRATGPVEIGTLSPWGTSLRCPTLTQASWFRYAAYQMPTITETA